MKPSRVRLAVSALLFVGWIGWLAYLAATTTRPVVLSRPQFLAADLYVIADVRANPTDPKVPAPQVTIKQVIWPSAAARDLDGKELPVKNLPLSGEAQGWKGPGEYILPLSKDYQVTAIPRSPGYRPEREGSFPVRIYEATAGARRELQDLVVEFHREAR